MSIITMEGTPVTVARGGGNPTKKVSPETLEKMKKEDQRLVKGVFRCHQPEGGSMTFPYRKYKGEPIRMYTLQDGQTYEIPKGVAKHINSNVGYYVHSNVLGADGNPAVDRKGKRVSRANFESLEFYE